MDQGNVVGEGGGVPLGVSDTLVSGERLGVRVQREGAPVGADDGLPLGAAVDAVGGGHDPPLVDDGGGAVEGGGAGAGEGDQPGPLVLLGLVAAHNASPQAIGVGQAARLVCFVGAHRVAGEGLELEGEIRKIVMLYRYKKYFSYRSPDKESGNGKERLHDRNSVAESRGLDLKQCFYSYPPFDANT